MSNIVSCDAEVTIHDGQVDHLKAVMSAMIDDIQRDEPGMLNYEWFLADDGKSYQVYERRPRLGSLYGAPGDIRPKVR